MLPRHLIGDRADDAEAARVVDGTYFGAYRPPSSARKNGPDTPHVPKHLDARRRRLPAVARRGGGRHAKRGRGRRILVRVAVILVALALAALVSVLSGGVREAAGPPATAAPVTLPHAHHAPVTVGQATDRAAGQAARCEQLEAQMATAGRKLSDAFAFHLEWHKTMGKPGGPPLGADIDIERGMKLGPSVLGRKNGPDPTDFEHGTVREGWGVSIFMATRPAAWPAMAAVQNEGARLGCKLPPPTRP